MTRIVEGTATESEESMVTMTAANTVTRTAVGTKNSVKWIMYWDLTSE